MISEYIIKTILEIKKASPILVCFDGVDTSGKTTLADSIYEEMKKAAILDPIRVSIDKYLNPREIRIKKGPLSPEGYFSDSFNYPKIFENVINPVKNNEKYIIPAIYDYRSESKIEKEKKRISHQSVILFDGIFMNRDELHQVWDLSIFLHVDFDTVLHRAVIRDESLFGSKQEVINRYQNRYIPGEKIYLDKCKPQERADIVIDNNDYNNPKIIKKWAGGR